VSEVYKWIKAVIRLCVKIKGNRQTAAEMLEVLQRTCDECLFRTSVFEWHKIFKQE
jgi:hypothetical protein